ncbi:Plastid division protein cdp1 chloroplastic [Thalictrum thalictroides]|uniref:Plastid division protein cdp1 chloroplastic n=1 Tax=Thalictrum thalictroides TaxID=46969 RepID=A0A7J6WRL0_THATH|nr:Plastid division protein cdp1 chloroplastic [Thalictrum thalictroides]
MALVPLTPSISSCCCCRLEDPRNARFKVVVSLPGKNFRVRDGLFPLEYRSRRRREFFVEVRGRMNVTDPQTTSSSSSYVESNSGQIRSGVEIPVSCYQIIGVSNQAEKDEIVKSVMDLKNAEVEDGYTMDVVVSRQEILMDMRDKLLFEPEYAGSTREKVPPKSSLRIPWSWVPGALCLLQEAGEEKLVLEIGQAALQHPDANPYTHDVLLSMALAEVGKISKTLTVIDFLNGAILSSFLIIGVYLKCSIAKNWFEKNKVSKGFEALARAQYLLKNKTSLADMPLLPQIEESLEELAPACTLERLDMPQTPENAEGRRGAIAALRELLSQGLDVEISCQVRDWPYFLSQALNKLMATEIIDLLPWDNIAVARKNKKSLESQNQRVVIDFSCFYKAMIAHIAVGFSNKQTSLIDKAKTICECLIASEGVDLKFEDALCSFLLGQGTEAKVIEKLRELEIDSGPASRYFRPVNADKEACNGSNVNPSMEKWLKDTVLGQFLDTRDCSPSLDKFFKGEKRALGHTKQGLAIPKTFPSVCRRPSFVPPNRLGSEESLPHLNSTRHIGVAATQLAPPNIQSPLATPKTSGGSGTAQQSVQLKRKLGSHQKKFWESWSFSGYMVPQITLISIVGCFVFVAFKLLDVQMRQMRSLSHWNMIKPAGTTSTHAWTIDPSRDHNVCPARIGGSNIGRSFKNLLTAINKKLKHLPDEKTMLSSSPAMKKQMPVEEAEALVKQWQEIKAEALGPEHQVHILSEVLAAPMLVQWQALADSAKARACFWRFVLLQLSVLRADILYDADGSEIAEIEALLEEAAELVDDSQAKNPNYYSTYKIQYILKRQYDGSWRFCRWGIQTSV